MEPIQIIKIKAALFVQIIVQVAIGISSCRDQNVIHALMIVTITLPRKDVE